VTSARRSQRVESGLAGPLEKVVLSPVRRGLFFAYSLRDGRGDPVHSRIRPFVFISFFLPFIRSGRVRSTNLLTYYVLLSVNPKKDQPVPDTSSSATMVSYSFWSYDWN
jgi:hypothetical protein